MPGASKELHSVVEHLKSFSAAATAAQQQQSELEAMLGLTGDEEEDGK